MSDKIAFDEYGEYCEQQLQPGDVLGANKAKLRLIQKLGSGAEGAVWYAQDEMHRQLAVKVVRRPVWDGNPELEESLRQMNERLSQVADANKCLPTIYAIDGDDQWVWYTMEAADPIGSYGQMPAPHTLEKHIQENSPDDLEDFASDVGKRLLRATRWLHHFGLAHNDIKPQNVLRFGGGLWKLGDLGMIGPIGNPPLLGTVGYFFDKAHNALEADLAAIARILFRVSMSSHESDEVERAFQLWRSDDRRHDRVVTRREVFIQRVVLPAWHEDPGQRFPSADAMLRAIEEFLKDSEAEKSGPTVRSVVPDSKLPDPQSEHDDVGSRLAGSARHRTVLSGLAASVAASLVYAVTTGFFSPHPLSHDFKFQNVVTSPDSTGTPPNSPSRLQKPPTEEDIPKINLKQYESLTPSDERLAMPPPAQGQLERIHYQVCNRTSVGIHLRFVNCTVLKGDRLPPEIFEKLTLGQHFQVDLPPGGHDTLTLKPFNQTSGSGWYLVFALPQGTSGRNADWQLLSLDGAPETAVNLFYTQTANVISQNTNVIIREDSENKFTLEVQQSDEPLQDCASAPVSPP